jgi:uncharacterized protein Yka (UPF0111/DUF47 family)
MVRFRLIPRDREFFGDFATLADELREGARLLGEMFAPDHPVWDKASEIEEIERKCDSLTHGTIERMNRTLVTAMDREDIHALASSLDGTMDAIDHCARAVRSYRIQKVVPGARELAGIVAACVEQVHEALQSLDSGTGMAECLLEMNRLENKADRAHQRAVERLLEEGHDPLIVIKWKQVLDFLEDATGRCQDVANVLEGVLVKHGP